MKISRRIINGVAQPSRISYALGRTLAHIHSFTFEKAGFFGSDLKIETPFSEGSSPYFDYILEHFVPENLAWKRMGDSQAYRFLMFIESHQQDFPVIKGGGVLVHSDFKMVNLIWDDQNGLTVLDWEFAHSGDPLLDFATLVRHFDRIPLDIHALEKGYVEGGQKLPERWIQKARVIDFLNYVQLLNSPLSRPQVYDHLMACIEYTMENDGKLDSLIRKGNS